MTGVKSSFVPRGTFTILCTAKDGTLRWAEECRNMVVNTGLEHILDLVFVGSAETQIDPWYSGIIDADPTIASTDTIASHAGWTEFTEYTGDRKEFVDSRSNRSVSNSASKAEFAISTAGTVGGAFLCSSATSSTATLLCAAALTSSNRTVIDGDTVSLTYTFTAADA